MEDREYRNNYIFTLVKFALFLILFCFLVELTREFWQTAEGINKLQTKILVFSILSLFAFYTFVVDLNYTYKKIQGFFFRSSFFSYLLPSLLIIAGIGYFFLPKVLETGFDRNVFVFVGGSLLTAHLAFVARELKGGNFAAAVNYLFIFSILYILNVVLFLAYIRIGFSIDTGDVVFEGMKNGAALLQKIFTQALR